MNKRFVSLFLLGAVLVGLALPLSGTSAVAECPITLRVRGSTTVFPITAGSEAGFEATRPGTDAQLASIGSGNGLNELISTGPTDPSVNEVAPSSRPLNAGELAKAYDFSIGKDGFVIAVKNSIEMDFLTNITKIQVEDIYEGDIDFWDEGGLGGPHVAIVPRARITGSGSQPDFLSSFAVDSALESATIAATGLPRLTESSDMAAAAAASPYVIAYTSLANLDQAGMKVLSLNGVTPSIATVSGNTYPAPRELHLAVLKIAEMNRIDSSKHVLADDFINYALSSAGQAVVAAQGFVPVTVPLIQPIPDWDVNMNGSTSLSDLGAVTSKWGQSSACKGYIRADVNNSNNVSLGDIGGVTSKWGNPGFAPPN
jgi:phosphate transport system substrate-binding protein